MAEKIGKTKALAWELQDARTVLERRISKLVLATTTLDMEEVTGARVERLGRTLEGAMLETMGIMEDLGRMAVLCGELAASLEIEDY